MDKAHGMRTTKVERMGERERKNAGTCKNIGLLLKKSLLLKIRDPWTTVSEFLIPLLLCLLLLSIRSAIDIKEIPEQLHLDETASLSDPQSLFIFIESIACGARDERGNRATSPSTLAITTDDDELFANMARHYRDSLIDIVTLFGQTQMNCTTEPILCSFGFNADAEECQGPFEILEIDVVEQISRTNFVQQFSTNAEMLEFIADVNYGGDDEHEPILFNVEFSTTATEEENNWGYVIHGNRSAFNRIDLEGKIMVNDRTAEYDDETWRKYLNSGTMFIQSLTDSYIVKGAGEAGTSIFKKWLFLTKFVPFPVPEQSSDALADDLGQIIGLYFVLSFMWPYSRMVRNIVQEKEDRLREGMRVMGMANAAFWLSHIITYTLLFLTITVIATLLLCGSFFQYSAPGVIFLMFFLFGLSLVAMACFVASCLNVAKTSGTLSLAFLLVSTLPGLSISDDTSPGFRTLLSLFCPTAMGLGFSQILTYESAFVGVSFDNLVESEVAGHIQMLVFDIFFYLFLSWYCDKVVASKLGIALPWYFCCTPRFWCKPNPAAAQAGDHSDDNLPDTVQAVPDDLKQHLAVSLRGVRKEFGKHVAVKGLNLDIYEGQIFVLLGHNGAGKSTTINMLTGMLDITSGSAMLNGIDASTNMDSIRSFLGVCPQHDVLFANLTVKEHLFMYGQMKGVPPTQIEAEVHNAIEEIQMSAQTNQRAGSMSGGQKRRLSLAIALIGGSKIVFLDEPTSGVDPFSRRAIWDLLQKKKAGRVIILTTHFMDEADQLGDRIAIMHHGALRCCGSSLFLKKMFGVGYNIVMSLEGDAKADSIGDLVTTHVPQSDLLSHVGTELSYRLPLGSSGAFPALLKELEERGAALGCNGFGMSVTTLEEVFLKVAREEENPEVAKEMAQASRRLSRSISHPEQESDEMGYQKMRVEGEDDKADFELLEATNEVSFLHHFKALMLKRWHNAKRDRRGQCCQFVTPSLILLFGFILLNFSPQPTQAFVQPLDFSLLNQPHYIPFNSNFNATDPGIPGLPPAGVVSIDKLSGTTISDCTLDEWDDSFSDLEDFSRKLLSTRNEYKQSKYGAFCFGSYGPFLSEDDYAAAMEAAIAAAISGGGFGPGGGGEPPGNNGTDDNETDDGGDGRGDGEETVDVTAAFYNVYTNSTHRHAMPMYWSILSQMFLRQELGDDTASIHVSLSSFPSTKKEEDLFNSFSGIVKAIIIAIGMAFVPSAYVVFVVKERELNSKHLQLISGVDIFAYWLSNYVFDFLSFLLTATIAVIIVLTTSGTDAFVDNPDVIIVNMLAFGLAVIPFSYVFSFLFNSASTAQNIMVMLYIMSGVAMLIASFIFRTLESTQEYGDQIRFAFRLFPNFCLGDTFFYMSLMFFANTFTFEDQQKAWDLEVGLWNIIFMLAEAVVYFLVVLALEYSRTLKTCCKPNDNPALKRRGLDLKEDQDVEAEKTRVTEGQASNDLIRLEGLRRVFPQKVAVNDLHFGIPRNECFGFLGVNGAGKSTTLKMLTGDETPDQGDAFLGGKSILSEKTSVRRLMGYCPQFDALHPLMTGQETLEFYGRIRGVPESRLKAMVKFLAQRLTLDQDNQHLRPAGTYSGGNKRKLSVGIALIGNPPVVFLDEPSTGMDPVSRRFMWDFISQTMTNRAVILTTHSMEECEALCSRIGILVHGRLKCLGSSQHLKTRFGNGFEFLLNVQEGRVDQIRAFVNEHFSDINEVESYGGNIKYQLGKQDLKLSQIFSLLEDNKEKVGIVEYSIGQSTLEQIFISFAGEGEKEFQEELANGFT